MTRLITFFFLLISTFTYSAPLDTGNFTQPENPTESPPFVDDTHLPVVFVNNSGLSDAKVYILFLGKTPEGGDDSPQVFVEFGENGIRSLHEVMNGDNGSTYTKSIQEFTSQEVLFKSK